MEKLNKEQFMDRVREDHERKEKQKQKGKEEARKFAIESTIRVGTKKLRTKGRRLWHV
jgi:hypothetical protein